MKNKIITLMVLGVFISFSAFSQDTIQTSHFQKDTILNIHLNSSNEKIISYRNENKIQNEPAIKPMYRDTRLGSSCFKQRAHKRLHFILFSKIG